MCLLGVLGLALVLAGKRRVALAVFGFDDVADLRDRFRHDLHAVGSHVGNEAHGFAADVDALIEPLGDIHRLLGGEAELARGIHLQRRGRERREGVALRRFLLDLDDAEVAFLDRGLDGMGGSRILDVELLERLAVDCREAGSNFLALGRREQRLDRPVFLGLERLDLGFAVADEPERDRLHTASRAGARQLAPQHRRQREADEIVESAACEIGLDQRRIDLARLLHGGQHRLLGHGVESDALDRHALFQRPLLIEHLQDVPGDGLAFTIWVGGEDQLVRLFDRIRDLAHDLGGLGIGIPMHGEIAVGLHRAIFRRQVADMPERGNDLVS